MPGLRQSHLACDTSQLARAVTALQFIDAVPGRLHPSERMKPRHAAALALVDSKLPQPRGRSALSMARRRLSACCLQKRWRRCRRDADSVLQRLSEPSAEITRFTTIGCRSEGDSNLRCREKPFRRKPRTSIGEISRRNPLASRRE